MTAGAVVHAGDTAVGLSNAWALPDVGLDWAEVLPAAWSCIPMMTSSDMSVATISPVRSLLGSSAWDHTVCGPIPRPAMNPM
jgi:hypothetical protein